MPDAPQTPVVRVDGGRAGCGRPAMAGFDERRPTVLRLAPDLMLIDVPRRRQLEMLGR